MRHKNVIFKSQNPLSVRRLCCVVVGSLATTINFLSFFEKNPIYNFNLSSLNGANDHPECIAQQVVKRKIGPAFHENPKINNKT